MADISQQVIAEVKKVIIGKDEVIRKIWIAILAGGHVLLEDVPGVGKTTMALSFAKALGLDVRRIQFTPDTMPSDIIGFSVFEQNRLVYQPGAVMCNLLLADEINRTSSKTQSALLEAMEEKSVTVDGTTHLLPDPFVVLATQNPVGSAGTQNLPNSQLDRFLMRLHMGYPDITSQINILKDRQDGNPLDTVQPIISVEGLRDVIAAAGKVYMSDSLYDYVARFSDATRSHARIQLGVSPRAAFALCRVAKAKAYVEGRDYTLPADVLDSVHDVYAHRLILSAKARLDEVTAEMVLDELMKTVPLPEMTEKNL